MIRKFLNPPRYLVNRDSSTSTSTRRSDTAVLTVEPVSFGAGPRKHAPTRNWAGGISIADQSMAAIASARLFPSSDTRPGREASATLNSARKRLHWHHPSPLGRHSVRRARLYCPRTTLASAGLRSPTPSPPFPRLHCPAAGIISPSPPTPQFRSEPQHKSSVICTVSCVRTNMVVICTYLRYVHASQVQPARSSPESAQAMFSASSQTFCRY